MCKLFVSESTPVRKLEGQCQCTFLVTARSHATQYPTVFRYLALLYFESRKELIEFKMSHCRSDQRRIDGESALKHVIHNILGYKADHPLLDVLKFAGYSTFDMIWMCFHESAFIEDIVRTFHPDSASIELYSLRQIYSAALLEKEWRRSGVRIEDLLSKWESTTTEQWMCWVISSRLLNRELNESCRDSIEMDFGCEHYCKFDDRYLLEVLLENFSETGDTVLCLPKRLALFDFMFFHQNGDDLLIVNPSRGATDDDISLNSQSFREI